MSDTQYRNFADIERDIEVEYRVKADLLADVEEYQERKRGEVENITDSDPIDSNEMFKQFELQDPVHIIDFYDNFQDPRNFKRYRAGFPSIQGAQYFEQTKAPSFYDSRHSYEKTMEITDPNEFLELLKNGGINIIIAGSRSNLYLHDSEISLNFDRIFSIDRNKFRTENLAVSDLYKLREYLADEKLPPELIEFDLKHWTELEKIITLKKPRTPKTQPEYKLNEDVKKEVNDAKKEIIEFAKKMGVYELDDAPRNKENPDILATDVRGILVPHIYPEIIYNKRLSNLGF